MRVYTRMSHQVNQIPEPPLSVLIGHQLSSVEFVQDYLQLRFDGPCLTAVTHPRVRVGQLCDLLPENWAKEDVRVLS